MKINDLLYKEMKTEYDSYAKGLYLLERELIPEAMEQLYFHKRMLSVLSGQDLQIRSAIGLYALKDILLKMVKHIKIMKVHPLTNKKRISQSFFLFILYFLIYFLLSSSIIYKI